MQKQVKYVGFRNVLSKNPESQEAYIELNEHENITINGVHIVHELGTMIMLRYCGYDSKYQNDLQEIKISHYEKPTITIL